MTYLTIILMVLTAYLIGSVSSAIIICKLMGLPDPRQHGSQNPGATNVLRIGGKLPAALTLVGDMLKGVIPVAVAGLLQMPGWVLALVAIAAVIGHLLPVFFGFKGGKGVATALGALIGAAPIAGFLAISTWLAVCLVFRISSVAALATAALAPLYLLTGGSTALAVGFAVIAALLVYTHRSNLQRLVQGTEPKVGQRAR